MSASRAAVGRKRSYHRAVPRANARRPVCSACSS